MTLVTTVNISTLCFVVGILTKGDLVVGKHTELRTTAASRPSHFRSGRHSSHIVYMYRFEAQKLHRSRRLPSSGRRLLGLGESLTLSAATGLRLKSFDVDLIIGRPRRFEANCRGGEILDSQRLKSNWTGSTSSVEPDLPRYVEVHVGHLVGNHARPQRNMTCASGLQGGAPRTGRS